MASPSRRMSVEEFEALGEDPPLQRLELSEGELIVTPSGTRRHNDARDYLSAILRAWMRASGNGTVMSETDVLVGPHTVRRPDVAFYTPQTLEGVDPEKLPQPRPDIAFEVVSSNDRADDLMLKVRQYLEAGATAVWLIYPKLGMAHRYGTGLQPPAVRDTIEEPELIPGLRVLLSEIVE